MALSSTPRICHETIAHAHRVLSHVMQMRSIWNKGCSVYKSSQERCVAVGSEGVWRELYRWKCREEASPSSCAKGEVEPYGD